VCVRVTVVLPRCEYSMVYPKTISKPAVWTTGMNPEFLPK
jgi:hypothetical protein